MNIDVATEPLGKGSDGQDVYLKDIWPSNEEIRLAVESSLTPMMFKSRYSNVFLGRKNGGRLRAVKVRRMAGMRNRPMSPTRLTLSV